MNTNFYTLLVNRLFCALLITFVLCDIAGAQSSNRVANKTIFFPYGPYYHSKNTDTQAFTWDELTARVQVIRTQQMAMDQLGLMHGAGAFGLAQGVVVEARTIVAYNLGDISSLLNNDGIAALNQAELVGENLGIVDQFTSNSHKLPVDEAKLTKEAIALTTAVTDNPKNVPLNEAELAEETVGLIDPILDEIVDGTLNGTRLANENVNPSESFTGPNPVGVRPANLVQKTLSQTGINTSAGVAGLRSAGSALNVSNNALKTINTNPTPNVVGNLFR